MDNFKGLNYQIIVGSHFITLEIALRVSGFCPLSVKVEQFWLDYMLGHTQTLRMLKLFIPKVIVVLGKCLGLYL